MEYTVKYSKRKTVSIQVKDGAVIVHSPVGVSEDRLSAMVNSHREWVEKQLARQEQKKEKYPEPTPMEERKLRAEARVVLKAKLDYFSKIMGLKYGRLTISGAKTRFGSCSGKGNISFSYRLMMYPEAAIDYVVVHELAHLVHLNHSKSFHTLVAKYLPDWAERKKLLRILP